LICRLNANQLAFFSYGYIYYVGDNEEEFLAKRGLVHGELHAATK
jgi:hypothetical protein